MEYRYQYSLRSLLGVVTLFAVLCSLLVSFTPYVLALMVAAALPGAIAGRYAGQRPLGYFVGFAFAFRWTFLPLLFALLTSEDYPLATLIVVAIASGTGGVQGGNTCAAVDWMPLPSPSSEVIKPAPSPPDESAAVADADPRRQIITSGDDEFWTPARLTSGVAVALYMAFACAFCGGETALRLLLFCTLPLMCIWFPDFMADYRGTGLTWPRAITVSSPPMIVFVLGWVILALPVVVLLLHGVCR